jgi:hypothetical protein
MSSLYFTNDIEIDKKINFCLGCDCVITNNLSHNLCVCNSWIQYIFVMHRTSVAQIIILTLDLMKSGKCVDLRVVSDQIETSILK